MSGSGAGTAGPSAIVSVALFMVVLDNLVVSVALPTIHRDLGASIQSLEWTVNAYVLAYAVLLLTGAALGDRFGRKRMFLVGPRACSPRPPRPPRSRPAPTCSSPLAPSRAPARRWSRRSRSRCSRRRSRRRNAASRSACGRASAASPSRSARSSAAPSCRASPGTGSSGSTSRSGLVLLPLAVRWLSESRGPYGGSICGGLALASTGAFGVVFGLVRAQSLGWTSATVLTSLGAGALVLIALRRLRAARPRADAADVVLRQALLRGHQRRLAEHVLRYVRLDLLPVPVPAERARQHAPAGRPEAARVDGRLDGRGPARGRLLRAPGQPPVHGRRPRRCRPARSPGWRGSSPRTSPTRR